jgi:hypothetical protein
MTDALLRSTTTSYARRRCTGSFVHLWHPAGCRAALTPPRLHPQVAAILFYLFCEVFNKNKFVINFVVCVVLLALDFWTVRAARGQRCWGAAGWAAGWAAAAPAAAAPAAAAPAAARQRPRVRQRRRSRT